MYRFVSSKIKQIPKIHLYELGGILLTFFFFLFYNLLLTTTDWFEFDFLNTARVVNSVVHLCLWTLLAYFMNDILFLLWTNLLWRNLDVNGDEKDRDLSKKGCSSETLSWLTGRPLSGIHMIGKLRRGYRMALMIFSFLYLQRAAQGLFTNVNSIDTLRKSDTIYSTMDSGWFHTTMWPTIFLGRFTSNLRVNRNEAQVQVDGRMTKIWLPPNLNLSQWTTVNTSVLLPNVTCQAERLRGDWDNGTVYPFGRESSAKCFAKIDGADVEDDFTLKPRVKITYKKPFVSIPPVGGSILNNIGCFDQKSAQGLLVFFYTHFHELNKEHVDHVLFTNDYGVIEENDIFGDHIIYPLNASVYHTYTGIPCYYTLESANMTFITDRDNKFLGTIVDGTRRSFEPSYNLITEAVYSEFFLSNTDSTMHTVNDVSALFEFMYDIYVEQTEINRNLSYYTDKVEALLTAAVYAHIPHLPVSVQGKRSVTNFKIYPVSLSMWWGYLGTVAFFCSCLIVWWFAVFQGPKKNHLWHYDSRHNSWNYLYAKLDPRMSPEDAMNQNTIFYQDFDSQVVRAEKIDGRANERTGSRV
jgi:hypothetical protein